MPSSKYGFNKQKSADLALPSGGLVRVRRPDPQKMLAMGLLDGFDSLTGMVSQNIQEIEGKQTINPDALKGLSENMEDLNKGLAMMDVVLEYVVLEPKVLRPVRRNEAGRPILVNGKEVPLDDEDRDEEQLYTDDVDLEDKSFILQYAVGGVKDFETFRSQQNEFVGSVQAGEGVPMPSLASLAD